MRRLISTLQVVAMVVYCVFWPAIMDYFAFMFNCQWKAVAHGRAPMHVFFTDQSAWRQAPALLFGWPHDVQQCSVRRQLTRASPPLPRRLRRDAAHGTHAVRRRHVHRVCRHGADDGERSCMLLRGGNLTWRRPARSNLA